MVRHSMEAQGTTPIHRALSRKRVCLDPSRLIGPATLQAQEKATSSFAYTHAPSLRVNDRHMLTLTESNIEHRREISKAVAWSTNILRAPRANDRDCDRHAMGDQFANTWHLFDVSQARA